MRHRLLLLAASGSALALAMMSFPAVGAHGVANSAAKVPSIKASVKGGAMADAAAPRVAIPTLYNQQNNDAGSGDTSQNFEPVFSIYDGQLADDFTVPAGHTWTVQEVDVTGVDFGGPVISAGVEIYADGGGFPGGLVAIGVHKAVETAGGHLAIKLGTGSPVLGAGVYWVSVYAEQDFQGHGQWYLETRSIVHGTAAMFQNPGNGFGTGCTTWTNAQVCIPSGGPDLMFRLRGTHT